MKDKEIKIVKEDKSKETKLFKETEKVISLLFDVIGLINEVHGANKETNLDLMRSVRKSLVNTGELRYKLNKYKGKL